MRGPGIPSDTICSELIATIDLLPTFASILKSSLRSRKIDGMDMKNILFAAGKSPRKEFLYYTSRGGLRALDKEMETFAEKEKTEARMAGGIFTF